MKRKSINHNKSNRLEDLRTDKDKSQAEVAAEINIHQTTLSKYEKGTLKNIPIDLLCKLADYYETSTDYILMRTNVKNPYK